MNLLTCGLPLWQPRVCARLTFGSTLSLARLGKTISRDSTTRLVGARRVDTIRGIAGLIFAFALTFAGPSSAQTTPTCYDGTYVVPAGVTQVNIDAFGASGSTGGGATGVFGVTHGGGVGGQGAWVHATLVPVTPGQTLYYGAGSNTVRGGLAGPGHGSDYAGGDGGHGSYVSTAMPVAVLTTVPYNYWTANLSQYECQVASSAFVVVAAGGGGGGGGGNNGPGGTGGAAGSDGLAGDQNERGAGGPGLAASATAGGGGGSAGSVYNYTEFGYDYGQSGFGGGQGGSGVTGGYGGLGMNGAGGGGGGSSYVSSIVSSANRSVAVSNSGTASVTILPYYTTTTSISGSPNPGTSGQSVTFTLRVTRSDGAAVNNGTVVLYNGVTTLGSATISNGIGTFATAALPVGDNYIQAFYAGYSGTGEVDAPSWAPNFPTVFAGYTVLLPYKEVINGVAPPPPPLAAPVVTQDPASAAVSYSQMCTFVNGVTTTCYDDVSFTSAASGYPVPLVQWQVSTDGGTTWSNYPDGAGIGNTITMNPPVSMNGYQYRAVFTNTQGTATSKIATLTVTPAALHILANNQTIPYGGQAPTFTATYGDATFGAVFRNGDTVNSLGGQLACTTTPVVTPTTPSGNYPINCSGLTSQNYAITWYAGNLYIQPPFQTITVNGGVVLAGQGGSTNENLGTTYAISASGGPSGNPLTFSVDTIDSDAGSCAVTSLGVVSFVGVLHAFGVSHCYIDINLAGNAIYPAAPTVTLHFDVHYVAPSVTTQPVDQSIAAGQSATFNVAVSGAAQPTVQWQVSGDGGATYTDIAGATSTTLTVSNATSAMDGYLYRVAVTNNPNQSVVSQYTDITSNAAVLSVSGPPVVTLQPLSTDTSVSGATTVVFTSAAIGKPTPSVQWQVSTDNGATFGNLGGATSTTLSFAVDYTQDKNRYRAVFTNSNGTAVSNDATLRVGFAPVFVTQPTDQSVIAGQTATFTTSYLANPNGPLQWMAVAPDTTVSAIGGATSNTLTLNNVTLAMNGSRYAARVDQAIQYYSNVVTLTVIPNVPTFSASASATTSLGGVVSDSVTLAGGRAPTGSITFNLYNIADSTCESAPLFTSMVTVTGAGTYNSGNYNPTIPGTFYWTASYSGDDYNSSLGSSCNAANQNVIVNRANIGLSGSASTSVAIGGSIGDQVNLSGVYWPPGPVTYIPITFKLYAPTDTTCSGAAIFSSVNWIATGSVIAVSDSYTPASPGTYRWIVSFVGNVYNEPVSSSCNDSLQNVVVTPTSTAISGSASAGVVVGGSISDQATLSGGVAPSGTVTFTLYAPADTTCMATPIFTTTKSVSDNGTVASDSFATSLAGAYHWVAIYSGDTNNAAATSPCGSDNQSVVVAKASPAISAAASATVAFGGAVSDQVTLSGGETPSGTIVFNLYTSSDAACAGAPAFTVTKNIAGSGNVNSDTYVAPAAGTYHWLAIYTGDDNNSAASSSCGDSNQTVVVALASQSISFRSAPSIAVGGTGLVTAVGGASAIPVTFSSGSAASICTVSQSGSVMGMGVGTCVVTANQPGDMNYLAAPSITQTLSIVQASSSATLVSDTAASVFGQSVMLTATVTSGNPSPDGSIAFADNGAAIPGCAAVPLTNAQAQCSTSGLSVATHAFTAIYSGDGNTTGSTNATALSVVVAKAATMLSLTAPSSPTFDQSIIVTAGVSVTLPGAGVPGGTITISDGDAAPGDSCNIVLPALTCTLTPSAAGALTLSATYSGDSDFSGSTATSALNVTTRSGLFTFTSSPNPSTEGQAVTFSATVSVATPSSVGPKFGVSAASHGPAVGGVSHTSAPAAIPTGTITFSADGTALATVALDANGSASYSLTTLGIGGSTITASYSGDADTAPSSTTLVQQVDAAPAIVPVVPAPALNLAMLALLALLTATIAGAALRRREGG